MYVRRFICKLLLTQLVYYFTFNLNNIILIRQNIKIIKIYLLLKEICGLNFKFYITIIKIL